MVLVETYALLLNHTRQGRAIAIRFLDWAERTAIQIERVRQEDEHAAIALVRDHDDKTYSLCDAMNFVVMERLGIHEAIAFDGDFQSYGRFTVL